MLTMATGTCSLECPSPNCTLGVNGARYKTPELEGGIAMQMLVMHKELNHNQPVQMVEAGTLKHKAEKVSRPVIKMGSSEDGKQWDGKQWIREKVGNGKLRWETEKIVEQQF